MARRKVFLLRHGETGPAWRGRYVGRLDPPLAGHGPSQARWLAGRLASWPGGLEVPLSACVTSPLLRCRQTAERIAVAVGCRFATEADLREIDFGRWEGKDFAAIAAGDPDLVRRWRDDPQGFCFPGGESWPVFFRRVRSVLERLLSRHGGDLLIVSHGGVIRAALCLLLRLDPGSAFFAFTVPPGALVALEQSHGWCRLVALERPGFPPAAGAATEEE